MPAYLPQTTLNRYVGKIMENDDIKGKRFTRLVAIEFLRRDDKNIPIWLTKCDCGKEREVRRTYLLNGNVKSCGCLKKDLLIKNKLRYSYRTLK